MVTGFSKSRRFLFSGREFFFSIKSAEKQPKTKRFAKNKVVVVNGAVVLFVWGCRESLWLASVSRRGADLVFLT
jgi:hypothetical protein